MNEAYLRLVDIRAVDWQDRAHFMAIAVQTRRWMLSLEWIRAGRR